ncbi:MAG TPA: hypothetical protein PLZ42_07035, partial [Methanothrix sp.]|nr:hypothetical protein [Methanothrix sp.]
MHTSNFARSASHPKAVAISRTSSAAGPVARTSRSPLLRLLAAAKSGAIDEDEYTRRYRAEVPFRPTPPPSMSSRLCRLVYVVSSMSSRLCR